MADVVDVVRAALSERSDCTDTARAADAGDQDRRHALGVFVRPLIHFPHTGCDGK